DLAQEDRGRAGAAHEDAVFEFLDPHAEQGPPASPGPSDPPEHGVPPDLTPNPSQAPSPTSRWTALMGQMIHRKTRGSVADPSRPPSTWSAALRLGWRVPSARPRS